MDLAGNEPEVNHSDKIIQCDDLDDDLFTFEDLRLERSPSSGHDDNKLGWCSCELAVPGTKIEKNWWDCNCCVFCSVFSAVIFIFISGVFLVTYCTPEVNKLLTIREKYDLVQCDVIDVVSSVVMTCNCGECETCDCESTFPCVMLNVTYTQSGPDGVVSAKANVFRSHQDKQCAVDQREGCSASSTDNTATVEKFVQEYTGLVSPSDCYVSIEDSSRVVMDDGDLVLALCHCTWPVAAMIICWVSFGLSSWYTKWWRHLPASQYCLQCHIEGVGSYHSCRHSKISHTSKHYQHYHPDFIN